MSGLEREMRSWLADVQAWRAVDAMPSHQFMAERWGVTVGVIPMVLRSLDKLERCIEVAA